jgi:hypothetical protein
MIPMVLRFKIRSPEASFGFLIPLVLVYLLFIPVLALGVCVYVILLISPKQTAEVRAFFMMLFALPGLLTACKGTEIDIHSDDSDVTLYIR